MRRVLCLSALLTVCAANYDGPYLFWGLPQLGSLDRAALNGGDDDFLKDLFAEAKAVILFVKNSTHQLSDSNYPALENILTQRKWAYMPQNVLLYDPVDYNQHTDIIRLTGNAEQEDVELAALFRDAELKYGDEKVLGILANSETVINAFRRRRREVTEAPFLQSTAEPTTPSSAANEIVTGNLYYATEKALLYTTTAPILRYMENGSITDNSSMVELKQHGAVLVDERDQLVRLIIIFITNDGIKVSQRIMVAAVKRVSKRPSRHKTGFLFQLHIRFRFPISGGYWSLTSVEFEENRKTVNLTIVGAPPQVPLAFSWKCSQPLIFKSDTISLTLQNIQVSVRNLGGKILQ